MPGNVVEVQIQATGVDGVQRQLRLVKDEVKGVAEASAGLSHSAAIGLSELSRGIGKVAQAGQLGAFSMREFTGAAFRLGEALGPAGVGTAIGLAVIAIGTLAEYFGKAGEATKKANQEFQSYIETLVHGSVVQASLAKEKLYSGDPTAFLTGRRDGESDIAFHARAGGQQYLEAEQARLQPIVDYYDKITHKGTTATTQQKLERDDYIKQLQEVTSLLNTNDLQLAQVSGVYDDLIKKEKELAAFQLQQMRDKVKEAGQVSEVPFGQLQRDDYYTSQLSRYRYGLMGDQINYRGPAVAGKNIYTGGQISVGKIVAAQLPHTGLDAEAADAAKQLESFHKAFSKKFATDFGNAIADGVTTAFETGNIGQAFAAFGKTMLAGIGGVFEDLGQTYLEYGGIMEALSSLLPDPFTAGPAALAIGAALIALGASLNAIGQSHAKSGGGGYGAGGALASQSSVAGGRNVTFVVQGSSFLDMNNPAVREQFAALYKSLGSTGEIIFTNG